jgi:multiple sugar transport system permease protein
MNRAILIVVACIMIAPFLLMLSGSIQSLVGTGSNVGAVMRIIPRRIDWTNYTDIIGLPGLTVSMVNSAILVAGYIIPAIIVNGLAAYAFVFYKFRWKNVLFLIAMASVFFPSTSIIIPRYLTMRIAGIKGFPAVLIMSAFWAQGLFLFRNYFHSIPMSLVESARIDGAGDWAIFSHVVLPMSKPIIGAAIVFQGIAALGDYLWQLINLTVPWQQPMIIRLYLSIFERLNSFRRYSGSIQFTDFGYSLAVGSVIAFPMILIFAFGSRYFISDLTTGAIKE